MAEGVLFHIAVSILKTLGSLAGQEIVLLWGLDDELQKLERTVSTIKAVLLDAEKLYSTSNEVKQWLDDLRDGVYDAEDLLGDISAKASRLQRMSGNKLTKEVRLFFSRSNRFSYGLKMAHEIKGVRAKLDAIAENRKFHLNPNHTEVSIADHLRDVGTHSSPPSVVIGRNNDRKSIISLLLGDHPDAMAVIPIVGFGGLGKTTLAQTVYNDELVKIHFDLRIWVCVSDTFGVREIVEKIIECVDGEKPSQNLEVETLTKQLSERTKDKKYLLVLDDVWNENREKWLQFYDLIAGGARGSRIMITTRSTTVAEVTSTTQPYQLKGLSEAESWNLFQQVSFRQGKAPSEEFEVIGKEIARKCCGLPLAIRTIGSLLYSRNELSGWKYFSDEEFSKLNPNSQMVETLKLSYNHLPSNLKQCFSYCSLFPKDYLFEVSTLISYWRAQGYINTSKIGSHSEDVGVNSFKYLLHGSFFQLANENGHGDDKVTCRMHDFMHDLAVLVAGEEINMVYPNPSEKIVTRKTRHMSLHQIPHEQKWPHVAPLLQRRNARSLIVQQSGFTSYKFDKAGDEQCRAIVDKMRCLRVLTLRWFKIYNLPSLIGRLDHLVHLDLSRNEMQKLPESITRLQNLQVLILDGCNELRQLPRNMKKLGNLIHLGLEGCDKLNEMPLGIGQLTSLQVLSQFSLSNKRSLFLKTTGGLDELHGLNKLRGALKIVNFQHLKKDARECEAANLKDKSQLRCLTLKWGNPLQVDDISSLQISLDALEPHVNLRELRFEGYGGLRFPRWVSSLENLVNLRIDNCYNCKSLPPLDGLPSLQLLAVAHANELEYMISNILNSGGRGMSCFFPSLKKLSLVNCSKLKGWWSSTNEQLHYELPCLSYLEVWLCPDFKGWMPRLPSLNILKFWGTCSELLEETLKQAKPYSTDPTLPPLQSLSNLRIGGLVFLPAKELQSLASLKSLDISHVADTRILARWLHHSTSLESLTIRGCEEMSLFGEDKTNFIPRLGNLRSLIIEGCSKMRYLPERIQHFTSLERLVLVGCYELKSLPAWMRNLAKLNSLEIRLCPYLIRKCKSNQGDNWPSICRIPNIQVDFRWVQRNGNYQL